MLVSIIGGFAINQDNMLNSAEIGIQNAQKYFHSHNELKFQDYITNDRLIYPAE